VRGNDLEGRKVSGQHYICNVENNRYELVVIGGGAAGFFGAIQAAEMKKGLHILILEKSTKLLTKVKVSGGGRCNVTHNCFDPIELSHHYPRGKKPLSNIFKNYHATQTVAWFESRGVKLKAEDDGRMFPVTDNSQTIIDCLLNEAHRHKVKIEMGEEVDQIVKGDDEFEVITRSKKKFLAKKILVASGGSPKKETYGWIENLGHKIISPIPSLFTFNDSGNHFKDLMGVSVPSAEVKIAGTKLTQKGPVLITHWGLSGPAVIKLSAWAAEALFKMDYSFTALVSWIGELKEDEVRATLAKHKSTKVKQKVQTNPLFGLPQRLWTRLCELSEINAEKIWGEMPQKNLNKLIEFLIRTPFNIKGKTTFKEEFVTCGGVDLTEVNIDTMESKIVAGIFFAGEVLNIDGETGGFNFQSAWSTGYVAARGITRQ
jgi:predicted Rossmann fold flavoprotein